VYQPEPRVEFVLGQPAFHERDLQRADHLLAVGVGCPQAAAVRRGRHLGVQPCHR
jgi:hypothetical protein